MDTGAASKACTLVLHDDSISREVALCGSNVLPFGGIAYLRASGAKTLCIQSKGVTSNSDEVSIHVSVAGSFGFENRMKANVQIIENVESATATHVEISFRDQHFSRADMWRISALIDQTAIHRNQKLNYLGSATATVEAIYISGQDETSAFVSNPRTKLIFRSFSARFTFLIQISKEMLEHWIGGDLMFECLISGFFPELFRRWDQLKVRHQVSIVLFGRSNQVVKNGDTRTGADDFFHVVAEDVPSSNWRELLRRLKKAFADVSFPREVSLAARGNMLEAINVAAIDFAETSLDPQLTSTSTSVVAITAGAGLFSAEKGLLRHTTDLLTGSNTGVDIVSLSPMPLHPVPLFQYNSKESFEFALPHWLDISYWLPRDKNQTSKWLMAETADDLVNVKVPRVDISKAGLSVLSAADGMKHFDEHTFGQCSADAVTPGGVAMQSSHLNISDVTDKAAGHSQENTLSSSDDLSAAQPSMLNGDNITPRPSSPANHKSFKKPSKLNHAPHPLMKTNRKISLGPRGLALSQGLASTTVSAQHAQHEKEITPASPFAANEATSGLAKQIRETLRRKPSQQSLDSRHTPEPTKPIDIRTASERGENEPRDLADLLEEAMMDRRARSTATGDSSVLTTPRAGTMDRLADPASPWLILLNPCNPRKDNMQVASEYRQWKNIFPRAVSSAVFKWDSICKPASLPLIAETRVSVADLDRHYNKNIRRLPAIITSTSTSHPAQQAMSQLIAIRLSAGFQVVPQRKDKSAHILSEHTEEILLSFGDLYHYLRCLSNSEVQITEYERPPKAIISNETFSDLGVAYQTRVRSSISRKEQSVNISLEQRIDGLDWSRFDDQSVNRAALVDSAGRFRMRIVLIPIEIPRTETQGISPARELSDDERRIDGIQNLTQMWQRNRVFTDEEHRHQPSMIKANPPGSAVRDPNPLAIEYQTRDPSMVVSALGTLSGHADGEMIARLFSESDLYQTNNFDMVRLVKHMQELPPSGVELKDRRWFTRLHLKCFRGDEMVNWLLRVFKDLQSREDAVALGNQLMHRDVFTHVRGRHEFRDGNYFYQIRAAHRTTDYPDTTGFFSKTLGRSVPSTPIAEVRESPSVRPVQSNPDSSEKGSPTPVISPSDKREKKREVLLSQKLLYNVDSSKKSDQVEIINLHYDRIHNPENCYHIQLDWTSTIPKLIRESIARWTALVEPYGLKLVQLPITEARKFSEKHPFDQPVKVKLSVRPPDMIPATPQFDPQSFSPRLREDANGYHKALLRKTDFVLDLESVHSFPQSLDVTYSWGRPDYEHTQFVHKSGLLLAQIVNDGTADFLLVPNRLALPSMSGPGKKSETITVEKIVGDFMTFCRDGTALGSWFKEVNKGKIPTQSPSANTALATDNDVPPFELPARLTNHRALLRQTG